MALIDDGQARASGLAILVVDGNRDAADTLGMLLSLWGYGVRVAYSGQEARKMADGTRFHAVISELVLPEMNGFQLARSLRASMDGDSPLLIAHSGLGREEDRTGSKEAGFHFHLIKPADPDHLLELLAMASSRFRQGLLPRIDGTPDKAGGE